jgi:GxxExxY protein
MDDIIELAEEVYSSLGPGFSERVYHNAMEVQLRLHNIPYETERNIEIKFKEHLVGHVRADLIVNNGIVVELKVGNVVKDEHVAQCNMYMKYINVSSGLIISFPLSKDHCIDIVECTKEIKFEQHQKLATNLCKDTDMYEKLRIKRLELAKNNKVPPYVIATNKSLTSMIAVNPTNIEQFKYIYGFSTNKIDKYGQAFLSVLNDLK